MPVETAPAQPDSPPTQEGGLGVGIGTVPTEEQPPEPSLDAVTESTFDALPLQKESEAPESEDAEEPAEESDGLPEGWQESERIKAFAEEVRREAQGKADRSKEREIESATITTRQETASALAAIHEAEINEAQQIGASAAIVENFRTVLDNALEDPNMERALSQVLARNQAWAAAYTNAQAQAAREEIANDLIKSPEFAVGLDADARRRVVGEVTKVDIELRGKRLSHAEAVRRLLAARDRVRDPIMARNVIVSEGKRLDGLARKKAEAETLNADRQTRRAAVPSGGVGGKGGYKTLGEARVDHAAGKITNDQMRAIRASGLPV